MPDTIEAPQPSTSLSFTSNFPVPSPMVCQGDKATGYHMTNKVNEERGTGNGERGTGKGERGTGVWEQVYSGNHLENSKWRSKQKKRLEEKQFALKGSCGVKMTVFQGLGLSTLIQFLTLCFAGGVFQVRKTTKTKDQNVNRKSPS